MRYKIVENIEKSNHAKTITTRRQTRSLRRWSEENKETGTCLPYNNKSKGSIKVFQNIFR